MFASRYYAPRYFARRYFARHEQVQGNFAPNYFAPQYYAPRYFARRYFPGFSGSIVSPAIGISTILESIIRNHYDVLVTTHTGIGSTLLHIFSTPLCLFGTTVVHSSGGTFECMLEGTIDGDTFITIQTITNITMTMFAVSLPIRGIRHTLSSMSSPGSVTVTTAASRHAFH